MNHTHCAASCTSGCRTHGLRGPLEIIASRGEDDITWEASISATSIGFLPYSSVRLPALGAAMQWPHTGPVKKVDPEEPGFAKMVRRYPLA